MSKALIFFADGLEEIEGLTVVDLLRRAGITIDIVSITGSLTIHGAHDIIIQADTLFEEADIESADMLILPGGMPGTTNLLQHEKLCQLLTQSAAEGKKWIAAICAAPSVLGQLGLLQGIKATSYPGWDSKMPGADYQTEKVVRDGRFITSRGMGTAIPFAGELVHVLRDQETADKLLASIIYS